MIPTIKLKAVVLTGGRDSHNPLLAGTGLQSKVMLPVGGRPMVLSVLEAIAGSRYRPEIHVSTSDPQIERLSALVSFKTLPSERNAISSFMKSLERLPDAEWVLFISGDHPLLTSEMIDYFIDESLRQKFGISAAVVDRSLVQTHYPDSRRSYFAVKGGAYSGGNMYLVNARQFNPNPAFLEAIDRNRKQQWKTVRWLGFVNILKFLFRRMDIHETTAQAARLMGCHCGVVIMPWAECCMDVDKPSDRDIAEEILNRRPRNEWPAPPSMPKAASS